MITTKMIKSTLLKARKIAIFGHLRPDLDCFGSMFSMKYLCQKLGREAHLFAVHDSSSFLFQIFDIKEVEKEFDEKEFDLAVFVDANEFSRIDPLFREKVEKMKNILVIDHHELSNEDEKIKYYVRKDFCAASLIVYDLMREYGIELDKRVATYLFAGVVGDTGRFLHTNTDIKTFEAVVELLKTDINFQKVYDVVYRSKTMEQVEMQKFLLNNIRVVNKNICYCIVTISNMKKLNACVEDVKFFLDDLNQIKDFDVIIVCYELEKNFFKASMRSKNNFNVQKVAAAHGGGGHKMAAGFYIEGNKKEIEEKLIKICEEF